MSKSSSSLGCVDYSWVHRIQAPKAFRAACFRRIAGLDYFSMDGEFDRLFATVGRFDAEVWRGCRDMNHHTVAEMVYSLMGNLRKQIRLSGDKCA